MKIHPERMSQVHSCNKRPQTGLDILGGRLSDAEINKKQDSGLNVKFRDYIPLRHFPYERIPTGHDEILLSLRGGISFVAELLGHESVQLSEIGKAGLCAELARRVPATYFRQQKPHVLDQLMLGAVRFFKYHGCWSLKIFRHGSVPAVIVEARRLYIRGLAEAVTKQDIEALFSNYNVEEITIPVVPHAQHRNRFAFVSLKTAIEAKDAIENLCGTDLLGRRVFIEHAGWPNEDEATGPSSTSRHAPSSDLSKSPHVALRSPKREGTSGRLETAPTSSKDTTRVVIKIEDDDNDPHEAADRGQSLELVQEAAVPPVKKESKKKAVAPSPIDMIADTLSATRKANEMKSSAKPKANTFAEASNREEIAPKTPDETDEKREKRKRSDQGEMREEVKRDHKRQKKDKKHNKDNKREKREKDQGQEAREDANTVTGSTKEPGKSGIAKKRRRKKAAALPPSTPKASAHEVEPTGTNFATTPARVLPRARSSITKQADHQDRQNSASPLLSKRHNALSKDQGPKNGAQTSQLEPPNEDSDWDSGSDIEAASEVVNQPSRGPDTQSNDFQLLASPFTATRRPNPLRSASGPARPSNTGPAQTTSRPVAPGSAMVPAQPTALPLTTISRPQPTISPGQQLKVTKRVYAADVDKDLLQEEVDKNKFLQDALKAVGINELDCRKIQVRVLKKGDSMDNAIARVCPGVSLKKRPET